MIQKSLTDAAKGSKFLAPPPPPRKSRSKKSSSKAPALMVTPAASSRHSSSTEASNDEDPSGGGSRRSSVSRSPRPKRKVREVHNARIVQREPYAAPRPRSRLQAPERAETIRKRAALRNIKPLKLMAVRRDDYDYRKYYHYEIPTLSTLTHAKFPEVFLPPR
eukprot:Trichotokara_eunicae@DN7945_c0_g1_i1.p1